MLSYGDYILISAEGQEVKRDNAPASTFWLTPAVLPVIMAIYIGNTSDEAGMEGRKWRH